MSKSLDRRPLNSNSTPSRRTKSLGRSHATLDSDRNFTNMSGRKPSLPLVLPARKSSLNTLGRVKEEPSGGQYRATGGGQYHVETLAFSDSTSSLDSAYAQSPRGGGYAKKYPSFNPLDILVKVHLKTRTVLFYCPRDITVQFFRKAVRKNVSEHVVPYAVDQLVESLQYMPYQEDDLLLTLDQQCDLTYLLHPSNTVAHVYQSLI